MSGVGGTENTESAAGASSGRSIANTGGRPNYPGRRNDLGWIHGVDVLGTGKKVRCNYCEKVFNGGIFRFKQHLASLGGDAGRCASVPDDVRASMSLIVGQLEAAKVKKRQLFDISAENDEEVSVSRPLIQSKGKGLLSLTSKGKSSGEGVQQVLNQVMKKNLKEQAYDEIGELFYSSAIPFNVVKNPAFQKMLDTVGRYGCGFKAPSYYDIREKILKRAVTRIDAIRDEFKEEWKTTGCTIMSDGWTDTKRRSICNFMVNSPKGTFFLYSLDTSNISKTTENVAKMLEHAINFVGVENVVQVVTDNAANYKSAGEKLMRTIDHLYWTPCAAHCIDLILEDFDKILNVHKTTIRKGRSITTYIYSKTLLIDLLRKETSGRDLIRPGATRFATSYLTLSCLSELETPLRALFDSEEWRSSKFAPSVEGKKVQKTVKDSQFWKNIAICLKAAGPMIEVLRLVDSEGTPAMGFIYDAIDTTKEKIKLNFKDVKKRYEPVWEIIDERWDKQLHRPLHAVGYYLNPHFHWDSNFRKDDVEVKEGLYSCLTMMVPNAEERRKIHTQLTEYHNKKGMFGLDDAQAVRKNLTPAEWWEAYGGCCPELMKFAIRVLSLTCSSSGCERNWSAFEMVQTKKRNRLHQKKMNDLVYVMYNLKLKNKPKKRNVVAPPSFEEIASDNEWITEVEEDANGNEEVGIEHLNDDDVNVDLDGVGLGSTSSSHAVHVNASGIRQDFSSDSDEGDGNDDDGGESEDDDGDDHAMEE